MSHKEVYSIEEMKRMYPNARVVYQFYHYKNGIIYNNNACLIGEPLVIEHNEAFAQKDIVQKAFDIIFAENEFDKEEIRCERYTIGNTWAEEYLMLNNGVYERSGIKEHMEAFYKPDDSPILEKYNLLAKAVNESTDECLPTCDSYGHEENCPTITPAIWIENLQKKLMVYQK